MLSTELCSFSQPISSSQGKLIQIQRENVLLKENLTFQCRKSDFFFSHSCLQMNTSARAVLPGLLLTPASANSARAQGGSHQRSVLPAAMRNTTDIQGLSGRWWEHSGRSQVPWGLITEVMGRSHTEYSLTLMLICSPSLFFSITLLNMCNIIHMLYIFSLCSLLENYAKCHEMSRSAKLMFWCLRENNGSSATLLTTNKECQKVGTCKQRCH